MADAFGRDQPPAHLSEKGREAWSRRRDLETRHATLLADRKQEHQRAHGQWERLREHYRDNEPVCELLDGHEPQLDEGGGWTVRSPVVMCGVDGFRSEGGEWFGLWPCWTYETLDRLAQRGGDGGG